MQYRRALIAIRFGLKSVFLAENEILVVLKKIDWILLQKNRVRNINRNYIRLYPYVKPYYLIRDLRCKKILKIKRF